jgi:hypothetical protein
MLLLFTAHWSWGQGTTTSSLTGTITDEKGESLPGATVIAVHTPTGTQYVGPSNAQGRYNIQNMRVGGPYTVRVTFVGFQEFTRNNVYLTLGQDQRVDVKLGETTTELAEATVVGSNPRSVLNADRSGPVTNVSTEQIQRLPTINRSLNDFLRLTPQAATSNGALAIGGGNYRQNNITVDGSDFNNNFGIGGNLPAGGSPISLDAIEAITINLTPFDVRQSGFVGSAVNAVTRSGSNVVSGSVYGFYRNQDYYGKQIGTNPLVLNNTSVKQFGFRVGGPIVKDKLFFFLNAERSTEETPATLNVAATDANPYGSDNTIARPRAADLTNLSNVLRTRYGYETGPYQGYNFLNENTRLLGRLDWNINSKNRFTIRYNQVTSQTPIAVNGTSNPISNFAGTVSRTSINSLPYQNTNYIQQANFYSGAAELNSTIGSRLFNTLRATYTRQNDPRSSNSSPFPFVDILNGEAPRLANGGFSALSTPLTSFGYELFTQGNLRDVETYSAVDFLSGTFGKHTVTGGVQFDLQSTKNGFQRYGTSYYAYNTIEDFVNGANPVAYALTYSLLPNYEQAFPRYKTAQYSAYLQDEYAVTPQFRLTYGLRAELNSYLNVAEVKTHPLVAAASFSESRRVDTGVLPANRVLFSPRVGFNWDVKGDRTLQVRGGAGIFTGRVPTVWLVSQSGDAGLLQVTQTNSTYSTSGGVSPNTAYGSLPGYANGVLPFSPDPAAHRPTTQPVAGSVVPSSVSATDPNFRNPQSLKTSLAVDAKLPGGIVGTVEGIFNRDYIVAYGQNYNLVNPSQLNVASSTQYPNGYADHREIYPSSNNAKFINKLNSAGQFDANGTQAFNAYVLTNGHKGYYWSATAKLEKQFSSGLFASLAYTRSDARNMYDGSGDQLSGTWSGTPIVNSVNSPALSYANYVVPDRVVGQLSYRKEYLKHLATQISFFYSGSSQGRFSYVYNGDLNRDGVNNNDLLYIPRNASEITFADATISGVRYTAQQQSDLFFRYVDQDDYLSKHRGEYAERNGAKLPWRNQIDFRIAQDVFVAAKTRNTLQFTLDIFNLGNFLNRNWGLYQTINNSSLLTTVATNLNSITPTGTVVPQFTLSADRGNPITSTFRNTTSISTNVVPVYYMQIGLRYSFN